MRANREQREKREKKREKREKKPKKPPLFLSLKRDTKQHFSKRVLRDISSLSLSLSLSLARATKTTIEKESVFTRAAEI